MRFTGKLSRDKRGIGSLIGAVFLILILVTGFAFYVTNLRTAEHYDQTLQETDDLDYDRSREKIVIEEVGVTGHQKLNVTVKNEGPISSHLILLGVYNETLSPQYYELDKQVNPSETETNIGPHEMGDDVVFERNQYTIQVITELGNIAIYSYPPEEEAQYATISNVTQIVLSNLTKVMGPILMDFKSLRWYSHQSGNNGTWWINHTETKLEWFATITNFGDQNLTLKYESAFAVFSVELGGEAKELRRWYIREESLLQAGETKELGFCWDSPNSGNYDSTSLKFLGTSATFLLLIGEWDDGTHFGENLPYQAIWVD